MTIDSPAPPRVRRRHWRTWSLLVLAVLLALAAARLSLVDGWWTPVRIVGPSMAPGLQGAHGLLICERCAFPYRFDIELEAAPSHLQCPNCGHWHDDTSAVKDFAGDRVLIDRWPLLVGTPQRMDVVAFRTPDDDTLAVKCVIGLPGEQLEIRDGEIYVDGQLWQKSLDEHRRLSALVHNNDFMPTSSQDATIRWRPSADEGLKLERDRGGYSIDGQLLERYGWRFVSPGIDDHDPCNPGVGLPTNDCYDIRVTTEVKQSGRGSVVCALRDGWHAWLINLDLEFGAVTLTKDNKQAASVDCRVPRESFLWEVAIIDQQVFVAINGQETFRHAYTPPARERKPVQPPIEFTARGCDAELTHLRVYRDVFWLDPVGLARPWKSERLGDDEYFLLGDSVQVSTDSRHFGPVSRSAFRGAVMLWETQRDSAHAR